MHDRKIKFVQINLARSLLASDDLFRFCLMNQIDVAMVQEPYSRRRVLTNLEYDGVRIAKTNTNE